MSSVAAFRALHARNGRPLILPNSWDALSARLIEAAGAEAVATSSAALAWAHGYRDGQQLPFCELASAVSAQARVLSCPLSVDLERGYADAPHEVAEAVAQLVVRGAVAVNLEDGGTDAGLLADKIRAVRERLGDGVFINARTDVAMKLRGPPLFDEVRARAKLYADAGADGLFVPWLFDAKSIAAVVKTTELPLNVMLLPMVPKLATLAELGVRRLSLGVSLAEVAYSAADRAIKTLLGGDYGELISGELLHYPSLNGLFTPGGPEAA